MAESFTYSLKVNALLQQLLLKNPSYIQSDAYIPIVLPILVHTNLSSTHRDISDIQANFILYKNGITLQAFATFFTQRNINVYSCCKHHDSISSPL